MIKFTKMQGLGNDYVYIDAIHQNIKSPSSLAKFISNRNFGIGSDGLILICKSDVADFKMRMFNQDGSEAEMCGNGIRCVGKFVYDKGLTTKTNITVETLAGIKNLELHIKTQNQKELQNIKIGEVQSVKVNMGEPILNPEEIPVKNLKIDALGKKFKFTCVSMGNPHAVTIVDNVQKFDVEKYGKLIEIAKFFPNKTNVEFVQIIDKQNLRMRVWERGTGETLACGTGACATAVACYLNGYTNRTVNIQLLGGDLLIEWNEKDNCVYMTGPAVTVFEGILE